jgi:hypothetical protein
MMKLTGAQNKIDLDEDDGVINEQIMDIEINQLKLYKLQKSSLSCRLDRIKSFVVGGLSSRFWAMRKHINMMTAKDMDNHGLPFYSWECITLYLENRKIYLVIQNETIMNMFIKFLINTL